MTFYILIWPLISAIVLFIIVRSFLKEWKQAKSDGKSLI